MTPHRHHHYQLQDNVECDDGDTEKLIVPKFRPLNQGLLSSRVKSRI